MLRYIAKIMKKHIYLVAELNRLGCNAEMRREAPFQGSYTKLGISFLWRRPPPSRRTRSELHSCSDRSTGKFIMGSYKLTRLFNSASFSFEYFDDMNRLVTCVTFQVRDLTILTVSLFVEKLFPPQSPHDGGCSLWRVGKIWQPQRNNGETLPGECYVN